MSIAKIQVVIINDDGRKFEGEIHPEELFTCQLSRAISNNKSPIDALAFLADWGTKNLAGTVEEESRLGLWFLERDKQTPKCEKCNDTGVIETGNNDLPCDCPAGDTAIFTVAGEGQLTGKELRNRRR